MVIFKVVFSGLLIEYPDPPTLAFEKETRLEGQGCDPPRLAEKSKPSPPQKSKRKSESPGSSERSLPTPPKKSQKRVSWRLCWRALKSRPEAAIFVRSLLNQGIPEFGAENKSALLQDFLLLSAVLRAISKPAPNPGTHQTPVETCQ